MFLQQHLLGEGQVIIQDFGGSRSSHSPTFTNAYFVNLFQTWLIETKDNMGLIDLPRPRRSALLVFHLEQVGG